MEEFGLEYDCFTFSPEDTKTIKEFKLLFSLCKLIGDSIELNNDKDNTIAFLHAFKILVLFSGQSEDKTIAAFDRYIKVHNFSKRRTPIHDALLPVLPIGGSTDAIDLDNWRNMVIQSGPKAWNLFAIAPAIEKKLGRTPKDFQERWK